MDFTPLLFVICIYSCSDISNVNGNFVIKPQNQYSIVGTDNPLLPVLNCLAQPPGRLGWSVDDNQISYRHDVFEIYQDHFEVTGNDTAYEANLKFTKMDLVYANQYKCKNVDRGVSVSAFIIVIDGPYNCSSNANLADLVEDEIFSVWCELKYNAKWEPTMIWRDDRGEEIQPDNLDDGIRSSRMKRTITLKAQIKDSRSFTCRMEFGAPKREDIPADTEEDEFIRNNPGYLETYQTLAMDVKYTPRSLTVPTNGQEYNPGEKVRCSAEGNPAPEMKWVNLEGNDTKARGRRAVDLPVTKEMEGNRMFRCIATNQIRGTNHEIYQDFNFTVTIPTTTTTTTTTPEPTTTGDDDLPPSGQGLQPRGLSAGILAAIIISVIVLLILLALIIFCLLRRCRKAPSKEKEKQKPRLEGVDQVRRPAMNGPPGKPPHLNYDQKPPLDDIYKPQASPNAYDKAAPKWGEPVEPMYDVALDDTPRSRKPIQVYDAPDYTDFRRV